MFWLYICQRTIKYLFCVVVLRRSLETKDGGGLQTKITFLYSTHVLTYVVRTNLGYLNISMSSHIDVTFCTYWPKMISRYVFVLFSASLFWQELWDLIVVAKIALLKVEWNWVGGEGGAGFISMFLIENKSPRFFALWFAVIIASTGTFAPKFPLIISLDGFFPQGLGTIFEKSWIFWTN